MSLHSDTHSQCTPPTNGSLKHDSYDATSKRNPALQSAAPHRVGGPTTSKYVLNICRIDFERSSLGSTESAAQRASGAPIVAGLHNGDWYADDA